MNKAPIKRHEGLKYFSRDHHHTLLFCWKIRQGLQNGVATDRIKKFANWYWSTLLKQHFTEEEKYIFTCLDVKDPLIQRAKTEHKRLSGLFERETEVVQALGMIEKELESHVRFEERILFNEIQSRVSAEKLAELAAIHDTPAHDVTEEWQDKFWEIKK